jgi:hypothetical protein
MPAGFLPETDMFLSGPVPLACYSVETALPCARGVAIFSPLEAVMSSTTFDTLSFARKLQDLGFTKEQAEGFAQLQRELIDERLVTKDYLDMRLKDLEYRLTIRLGGMMAASIAIVAALVKLA